MGSQKSSIVATSALLAAIALFIFSMWQAVEYRREGFNNFARIELAHEVRRQNRVFADTGAYIISKPSRFSTTVWSKSVGAPDGARWVGITQDPLGLKTFCYDSQNEQIVMDENLEVCLRAFNDLAKKT